MWSYGDREEGNHMLISPVNKVRPGISQDRFIILLGPVLDSALDWDSKYLSAVLSSFSLLGSLGLSIPFLILHFSLDKIGRMIRASSAKPLRCTVGSAVWDYYADTESNKNSLADCQFASFIVHAHALAYCNWKTARSRNYLVLYWEMRTCRQLLKGTLSNLLECQHP